MHCSTCEKVGRTNGDPSSILCNFSFLDIKVYPQLCVTPNLPTTEVLSVHLQEAAVRAGSVELGPFFCLEFSETNDATTINAELPTSYI